MGLSFVAPLAGRDPSRYGLLSNSAGFQSTRPLRGATAEISRPAMPTAFQSTHPLRGATRAGAPPGSNRTDFNPRATCGARPKRQREVADKLQFQSTRPLRGATTDVGVAVTTIEFQSTRPLRGATALLQGVPVHR